jgi:hypothetical protein
MVQLIPFNQSTAGKLPGQCLANVRRGFGIPVKYPNAITAWAHTQQHTDALPSGLDVPLYYTYLKDGHINVQLKDGRCWSDGVIYTNRDAYLKAHPLVHYLGWGESINDIPVIGEDMSDLDNVTAIADARYERWEELVKALGANAPGETEEQRQVRALAVIDDLWKTSKANEPKVVVNDKPYVPEG